MVSQIKLISDLPLSRWKEYKNLRLRALKEEPQAFASSYENASKKSDEEWQQLLAKYREGKNSWMIFADKNNMLVGMVGAFQTEDDVKNNSANIIAMYVCPEERDKGVAKELLGCLLEKIRKFSQVKKVILEVNIQQVSAMRLYKGLKFKAVGKKLETLGDGKKIQIYIMEREL